MTLGANMDVSSEKFRKGGGASLVNCLVWAELEYLSIENCTFETSAEQNHS